jgi:hypothetical protein
MQTEREWQKNEIPIFFPLMMPSHPLNTMHVARVADRSVVAPSPSMVMVTQWAERDNASSP